MTRRQAGLEPATLYALRPSRHDLPQLRERIHAHLESNDGYLALSGGKDSTVVLHLTLHVDPNIPIVFFDSGAEFPETYTHIHTLADRFHLNLDIHRCEPPLLEILEHSGRWDHNRPDRPVPDLGEILINRPAAAAHTRHGPGELWGLRASESRGRAYALTKPLTRPNAYNGTPTGTQPLSAAQRAAQSGGVIARRDGTTAFSPIWNWSTADVWAYLNRHQVPINPVYERLQRLGAPEHVQRIAHIIDGGNLDNGRISWLRRGWPALFEDLAARLPRLREFV